MKLHPDKPTPQHVVTAYEAGRVGVNGRVLTRSLLLLPDRLDDTWGPSSYDALTVEHLAALTTLDSDVLLLGTGRRQRCCDR